MPPRTKADKLLLMAKTKAAARKIRKNMVARHSAEDLAEMGFDPNAPFVDPNTAEPEMDQEAEDEEMEENEEDREEEVEDIHSEPDEERTIRSRGERERSNKVPKMPKISSRLAPRKHRMKRSRVLKIRDEVRLTEDQNRGMARQYGGHVEMWSDNAMLGKQTFDLELLDISGLGPLCNSVITGITEVVTEKIARDIMVVAYNLFGFAPNTRVFPETNPCQPTAMPAGYLETRIEFNGDGGFVRPADIKDEEFVKACCYIAASTLRLFTKSAENYMKAFGQIKSKYYRFYKEEFPLDQLVPDKRCIEGLKEIYTNKNVYKHALIPFLYEFSGLDDPQGMCRLLYEQHLALTGMHAVSLFVKVCHGAFCLPEELSSGLWHRTTREALREIKDILVNHHLSDDVDNQGRATWKYARLLNDAYFSRIQTKNCKNLVCALAYMAAQMGIAGDQNVMKIVHLERMTQKARSIPIRWATRLMFLLSESDQAADGNDVTLEDSDYDDEYDD